MKRTYLLFIISLFFLFSCNQKKDSENQTQNPTVYISENKDTVAELPKKQTIKKNIAVFVPGIISGSPVYEMLVDGVKSAAERFNYDKEDSVKVEVFVFEAGNNQADWASKLTALAAKQMYDVIISSNPSLPDLVIPITKAFPKQKFILLDATCKGNENIFTICYNQYEQAYVTGYMAGLMSKSHKIGLIAAQEYPVMNEIIYPYFEKGTKAANSKSSVEFRIVGNWYDANKSAVIADSLIKNGVDVILPICGGASQGVINSAINNKVYITWFDDNGFAKAPGTIISSTIIKQKEIAAIVTENFLSNLTEWGSADMVGISDRFVKFIQDDPLYTENVPEKVQNKMEKLIENISAGKLNVQEDEKH